jgi:hypothetical protein
LGISISLSKVIVPNVQVVVNKVARNVIVSKYKWTKYQGTHYCFDEGGLIRAEVYQDILTSHCTVWILSMKEPKEKYGTWINVEQAKKAVEVKLELNDTYDPSYARI